MKTTISCRIDEECKTLFQIKYPYMLSRFLVHCIIKAINDKKFFDTVIFGD